MSNATHTPNEYADMEWVVGRLLGVFAVTNEKRELVFITRMPNQLLAERMVADHNASLTAATGKKFTPDCVHQLANCARSLVAHASPQQEGTKCIGYRTDKLGPLLLGLQSALFTYDQNAN